MSKLVFAQVFDDAKGRWVLRKVPEMIAKPQVRRKVRVGAMNGPDRGTRCIQCNGLFGHHFAHENGYITCNRPGSRNPQVFEYWHED